jgi:glycosyltransferase involved in cell wall biosynthesis
MVSILKEQTSNSRGILVFTHKERFIFEDPIKPLQRALEVLKSEYVLGMHWGWYHDNQDPVPYIDFHLAGDGTVSFTEELEEPRYTYCSRNFIPDPFVPFDCPTHWDIVTVATPVNKKRMHELLEAIIKARDEGVDLTALLYCPRPIELTGSQWDYKFFEMYESNLSEQDKEDIELATPTRTEDDIYPLPYEFIPYLYNAASAFTIFTQKEGECRVISEALLTGTAVIARDDLLGGGRDFLDETNSELFSSLDEAADIFADVSENPERYSFDPEYLRDSLWAPRTVPKFERTLEEIFEEYNEPFEGEIYTSNLSFKLPGHETTLPSKYRKGGSNDVRNQFAALQCIDYLCDKNIEISSKEVRRYKISKLLNSAKELISRSAMQIENNTPINAHSMLSRIYR